MTPDITAAPTSRATTRIKPIALRLPRGLADRVEEQSKLTGQSMNQLLVDAVRVWLGEGGQATEDRIAGLEANVTRAVTAFTSAAGELDDLKGRLGKLERLARQSGADI